MTHLRSCLSQRTATFRKAHKEAMWRRYYKLHTSPSFQSLWKEFVSISMSVDAYPISYRDEPSISSSDWRNIQLKQWTGSYSWAIDLWRRNYTAVCWRLHLPQAPEEDYSIKTPNERPTPPLSPGPVWQEWWDIEQCWLETCSWQGWTYACQWKHMLTIQTNGTVHAMMQGVKKNSMRPLLLMRT